jgi:oxygen-independent coproporphyrinogen III oxidase
VLPPEADDATAGQPLTTQDLLRRYDRPGPRYTSYPTAVEFHEGFDAAAYAESLDAAARAPDEPLSLYLHLPFCAERCFFCGCSVIATRKREITDRYLQYLERELALLAGRLGGRRLVQQYHWGGGTPTYLTPGQLEALHAAVLRHFAIAPRAEAAVEIDPRVTTPEQIDLLRALGFNRLSLGVQDFTPEVQAAINRHQDEASTRALFDYARQAGFGSINLDLVYGLPRQSVESFERTLASVVEMAPERIAVYSYAHVPWLRPNQRRIDSAALPPPTVKLDLFARAVDHFRDAGYVQIGMDHFATPSDELAQAAAARRLHRNFMGYTTRPARHLIAAGLTGISDVGDAFAQNVRKLTTYYAAVDDGRLPIERGYRLDADDRVRRHVITTLMCNFRLELAGVEERFGIRFAEYFRTELAELTAAGGPVDDGLVEVHADRLDVRPRGRLFVRNICMIFDRHLRARRDTAPAFSRTV